MLRRPRLLLAIIALGGAATAAACASGGESVPTDTGGSAPTSTSTGGSGGATGTGTGGAATGGTGGALPGGCVASGDTVLAIDRLYFGDTTWDDAPDTTNGWKQFGLDIDGLTSTGSSPGLCQPVQNASPSVVHQDGPNGLDNAFGKNVLPVFLQSIPSLSAQANAALVNGDFTILIRLGGLGTMPYQAAIPAKVYGGAYLSVMAPLFDGHDCWPVAPESLANPADIESAKLSFPNSSLTADHWDSVTTGDLDLTLQVLGFQGHAIIHHARLVMDLDPDHQGTKRGIISGVLDTEEFVAAINELMSSFDSANCAGGSFVDMIDAQIRQASDIMKDGTQDPNATCNGISIGLGFKAARVQFGAIGMPLAPKPDPCMP